MPGLLYIKKTEGIKYDLAQNKVNVENLEGWSLKNRCYVACVAHAFKTHSVKNRLTMWIIHHSKIDKTVHDSDYDAYRSHDLLVKEICEVIPNQPLDEMPNGPSEGGFHLIEIINFMALEIIDLFFKCLEMKMENSFMYFTALYENLYFNCNGTINLRRTVDRLWRDEVLAKHDILYFVFFLFDDKYISRIEKEYGKKAPNTLDDWLAFMGHRYFCDMNVFQAAVQFNNEIAVDYLWKYHISKFQDKYNYITLVLETVACCSYRTNIFLFLLFQVTNDRALLINLFEEHASTIIQEGNKNSRWHFILIKIYRMLKYNLTKENCKQILESLGNANENYMGKVNSDLLLEYFYEFNDEVRTYIVDAYQYKTEYTKEVLLPLMKGLVYKNGLTFIKTFLEAGNAEIWKNFFCSAHGLQLFYVVINCKKSNKFDTIKSLLMGYFTQEMLKELKIRIFKLIKNRKSPKDLKDLKDLIEWCNPGKEYLGEFKRKFENRVSDDVQQWVKALPY